MRRQQVLQQCFIMLYNVITTRMYWCILLKMLKGRVVQINIQDGNNIKSLKPRYVTNNYFYFYKINKYEIIYKY